MSDELKNWKTQSVKPKVAAILIGDGVSFSFNEEDGIVFSAPVFYVNKLIVRLTHSYGVGRRPIINEIK